MTFTRQWTIEPKTINSDLVETIEPKYNVSYDATREQIYSMVLTTDSANFTVPAADYYRAFELSSDQPITLGVYSIITGTVLYEFKEVTNMVYKGYVSVTASTQVWKCRTTGVVVANVTVKVVSS